MVANILPADPPPPPNPGDGVISQNSTFSEHGHVAYQLKGITKCSSIVANFLPTDPPLPTTIGRRGQEVKIQLFQNMVILHIKLKGITNAATW